MRYSALLVWLGTGCFDKQEHQRPLFEMKDHQADLAAARDALIRGDLAEARKAGARLARPDEVPRLPDEVRPHLDAVRVSGTALAAATTADEAATTLTATTGHCAACHKALGVPAGMPLREEPLEWLWIALAWEDATAWEAGLAGGTSGPLTRATTWDARRRAFATALATGGLEP